MELDDDHFFVRFFKDYPDMDDENISAICNALWSWMCDDNRGADAVDLALVIAKRSNIPIKGVFLDIIVKVAEERLTRQLSSTGHLNSQSKILKNHLIECQHMEIFRLNYFCDFNLEESIGMVAARIHRNNLWPKRKMDTLRREHRKWRKEHKKDIELFTSVSERWSESDIKEFLKDNDFNPCDPFLSDVMG